MEEIAWQTVARVLHRVQSDLDAPWDLARMAEVAGYQHHHFARLFGNVAGEPPASYVRRLRLERAAGDLLRGLPVAHVAERALYRSGEAFSRAFKRQFGLVPTAFPRQVRGNDPPVGRSPDPHSDVQLEAKPPGLDPEPRIELAGPFYGWTVMVPSFDPEPLAVGMGQLLSACPPDGPWQVGGIAQPWGWLTDAQREFRCLRRRESDERAPPAPLIPWSWPRDWFAIFGYQGPLDQIDAACRWMAWRWPEQVGVRLGYGPLFSLLEGMADPASARLHLAVRPLSIA